MSIFTVIVTLISTQLRNLSMPKSDTKKQNTLSCGGHVNTALFCHDRLAANGWSVASPPVSRSPPLMVTPVKAS